MANLIDVAQELEYVPEDQLASMIDDPNSKYPSFMVLSEVQRRTQMRKMYENEMSKMNQPQTTVAEEAVMGLMQGQGAMPMQAGMSSPVNSQGSGEQGMAPPVQMQAGGLTDLNLLTAFMRQNLVGGSTPNQTYSPNRMNNMFDKLLMQAQANDPAAIANIQTLLNLPEFQAFKQKQQAQPPSVLAQSFPDMNQQRPFDFGLTDSDLMKGVPMTASTTRGPNFVDKAIASATIPGGGLGELGDYLTQGDFSSPYEVGRTVTASALAPFKKVIRDVEYLGQPVTEFTKGLFGVAQAEELDDANNFRDAVNKAKLDLENLADGKAKIGNNQSTVPDATTQQVVSTNQPDEPPLTFQDVLAQIRGDEQQPVFEGLSQQNQQLLQQLRNKASDNTDVLGLTKETLERLPIPKLDLPEVTEEDRQKELSAYTLSSLAKIISGAKNVGEIGEGLGEAGIGLQALKKQQKKEERQALIDSQKEDIRRFGIASSLASSQLTQDQARLQGQISLANLESALTNHEFNRAKTEQLAKQANDKFALDVFNLVEGNKFNKDKLEILKQQAVNQGNQNDLSRANALLKLIENMQAEIGDFNALRTRFPNTDEGQKQYQNYISKKATEVARLEREINNLLGVQDIADEALAGAQNAFVKQ